jgi:Methyltransferase domain
MNRFAINDSMSMAPRLVPPSAWTGHLPFAFWVLKETHPRILVELGSHNGTSYLGFCQAAARYGMETRCFAVDTWQGDEHSGFYGEDVFQTLSRHNDASYAGFSQLMRMTFDDALGYFADGTIDLLHIDGLHTYDAVKHDFETWLPKLSSRGVVLFHDTMVRERNFGVWKLWAELRERYPAFEFRHSHGLGVLLTGLEQPQALCDLATLSGSDGEVSVQCLFEALGARIIGEERARQAEYFGDIARAEAAHHLAQGEQAYQWLAEERNAGASRMAELQQRMIATETALAEVEKRRVDERAESEAANRRAHDALRDEHELVVTALNAEIASLRRDVEAEKRRADESVETEAANRSAYDSMRHEHSQVVAALNDEVASLRRNAEAQSARAHEYTQVVAALNDEIAALRRDAETQSARVQADLRAMVQSQRWDDLFSAQRTMQERISAIEQSFVSRAAEDARRIAALEEDMGEREGELAMEGGKVRALEAQIETLYASSSWKITAPARWLRALLTGRS